MPPTRQCPARKRMGKPLLSTPATDPRHPPRNSRRRRGRMHCPTPKRCPHVLMKALACVPIECSTSRVGFVQRGLHGGFAPHESLSRWAAHRQLSLSLSLLRMGKGGWGDSGACILTRNTPAAFSALPTVPVHDQKSPAQPSPVPPDQAACSYWRGSLRRPGCSRRPAGHG